MPYLLKLFLNIIGVQFFETQCRLNHMLQVNEEMNSRCVCVVCVGVTGLWFIEVVECTIVLVDYLDMTPCLCMLR